MYELIYTSVSRGLLLGRSGFCPVAWTQGMPANFIPLLDRMDNYIHQLPEQQWKEEETAICFSCRHCKFGRKSIVLVSRIAGSGLDFQGKNNKIAHHFIFDDLQEYAGLAEGGVSVCLAEENFLNRWEQPPGLLPPFSPQTRSLGSAFAQQWESITGDAGWAGVIAEFFLRGESPGFYVACPAGTPDRILLELIAEVARLLPKDRLPEFTFSTLFVQAPVNWDCFLRFCPSDSPLLIPLQQSHARHFLSFTDPRPVPQEWEDCPLVQQARKGLPSREEQLNNIIVPDSPPIPSAVAALPGEDAGDSVAYVLKKTDTTLLNFVTAEGQNAAVVKSRFNRIILCISAVLILGIFLSLGYHAYSLMNLEKELAEPPVLVLPALVSKADEEPMTQSQAEAKAGCPVSSHELWRWYLSWKDRAVKIALPASLVTAEVISLQLGSIGTVREPLPSGWEEQAIRHTEQGKIIEVLPLKPVIFPDAEAAYEIDREAAMNERLIVSIPDLQICFPSEEANLLRVPCHEDVLKIDFLVGSEIWPWTPQFRPEFLAFLQQGQATVQNWMPVYRFSSDEEQYRKYFELWIGALPLQDFQSFSMADCIRQWNRLVPQYAELEQKLTLLQLRSKEEIRRFDPRAQIRPFILADWDLLKGRIAALLQNASAPPGDAFPAELPGLLNEAVRMLYEYAFEIFYQETGAAADATARKSWKEECQQMQALIQEASGVLSSGTEPQQSQRLWQELFEKLPEYSLMMQDYSQQAGQLKKRFAELKAQQSPLEKKLSEFAEKTCSTEFFRKYLERNLAIPFQESQYQELATFLNQKISYRWIETADCR